MPKRFLRSIGGGQIYSFNGVRYSVSSRFAPVPENIFAATEQLPAHMKTILKNGFLDLKCKPPSDIMANEYACPVAGKED